MKLAMTRVEWALGGLLLLMIVTFGAFLIFVRGEDRSPQARAPVATWSWAVSTARGAYELATPLAQRWAEDAQLLQARSDWSRGVFTPEHGKWTFHFYSPQRQEVAVIAVNDNSVSRVKKEPLQGDVQPAGASRWQVDSDEVVQKALQEGGQAFIEQHDQAEMVLILNAHETLVWTVALVDASAQSAFNMKLDAASGTVTELSRPR